KMQGVVPELQSGGVPVDYTGGIRGEVIMTRHVHATKFKDKANCRNAANGLMRRKDGEGSENLTLIVYDAHATEGEPPFSDEAGKISWLQGCGFTTVPLAVCRSPDEVIDYRASVMAVRASLDYDIDGLVVKEREINLEDASRARPDRQIAFKFSLEEAVSTLRGVEWSRSGGTYTPFALFDEVELNGTTVQRASLANPGTMRALGVRLGCKVVVVKRGEIIPKIERAFHEDPDAESPVPVPATCETCGTALSDEDSRLFCPNADCPKRVLHQLLKWGDVAGIRDLGEALVVSLFESGRVASISDFYTLTVEDLTPFFLNEESRAADKKSRGAEKVVKSIASHRSMSLAAFVAGFDIEGIGETSVEKLVAAGYDSLEKLLAMTEEQAAAVYGFAEIMARTAVAGLAENAEEMRRLSASAVEIRRAAAGVFAGKSFCFTGELSSIKRADAEQLVRDGGGVCKSSVTKDLSYLVTNDASSGSAKNQKAAKFGVPVIDEREFLRMAGESR
ncbi:MAG: DNA ligase (NAD(+)) LigA, partial [Treponemataceae bacterium]|nr:DNA ligase (NAD(+)) LigA [Treponemataceae bacterium]